MDIYKEKWTKLEQEIFSFLCKKAGDKLSQRDIAKELKVSPTAVSKPIKNLAKYNLINIEKTKTINFICFNRDNQAAIEIKRVENLKNIYISGFSSFLLESFPGCTIILFGSYSKGEDTISSDIDVAIIEGKEKILNLKDYEKTLNREISIHFYESFKKLNEHFRNNLFGGILLHGSINS